MQTTPQSYLLFFRDAPIETYDKMSADQRRLLLKSWNDWLDSLASKQKLQDGRPLEPEARMVSGSRGERIVDGPFVEAKEAVAGYLLLTVADLDEATEVARQCPLLPFGMNVEVRTVAEACHLARSLGQTAMKA